MKLLLGLLVLTLPVCNGYMYLTSAGSGSYNGFGTLRGEKPGNIWNPPVQGGNRIACGGKGNTEFMPSAEARMKVVAGGQVRIVGKLTMPSDAKIVVANAFPNPFVEISIKYGDRPNFQMTRGFTLNPVWAPTETGFFQLLRNIPDDALNNNATIQVAFNLNGTFGFFQCIDIVVAEGKVFPAGDFPWGKGPDDLSVDVPGCLGGACGDVDKGGLTDAQIAIIVLCVLIAIVLAIFLYCCCCTKKTELPEDKPQQFPIEVEQPPKEPAKPVTPPAATPPKEESDNGAVGHVIYIPATEDSDPTPQESSEQKSLDATGSQGRHFHFRYVEEDDDDGAKEDVV